MSSTITSPPVITNLIPDELAKNLKKVADAAIVDIEALQGLTVAALRASGASGQTVITAVTNVFVGTGLSCRVVSGQFQIWVA